MLFEMDSINPNLEVMDKFIRFINTGDTELGESVISPDVIFYAPTSSEPMHGFRGYTEVLNMMRGAMPDVRWTPEETIAEGNKVMIRFAMTGTHCNALMGVPPTGRKVNVTAINIYEFENGKIIREHSLPDLFTMLVQLGVVSIPENNK